MLCCKPAYLMSAYQESNVYVVQAAKAMVQVRKATGCKLPVTQLFNTPTIAGMAEALERLRVPAEAAAPAIPAADYSADYSAEQRAAGVPCSANQEQMLVLHQMAPESAAYHIVDTMRLSGALDAVALQVSISPLSTSPQMTTFLTCTNMYHLTRR